MYEIPLPSPDNTPGEPRVKVRVSVRVFEVTFLPPYPSYHMVSVSGARGWVRVPVVVGRIVYNSSLKKEKKKNSVQE